MNSPVQPPDTDAKTADVKRPVKTGIYLPFLILFVANVAVIAVIAGAFASGRIKIGDKYLEIQRSPDDSGCVVTYGTKKDGSDIKMPVAQKSAETPATDQNFQYVLWELLDSVSKNHKQNTLLYIGDYLKVGNYIPMSSIYEKILDTNTQTDLFATYKMNEELYESLGKEAENIVYYNNMMGSPEILDPSLHSLNIYKLTTDNESGYELIASKNGNFKTAKFFDEGNKLLAVERDYESNFYFYEYSVEDNSFRKVAELKNAASAMDYYGVENVSKNSRYAVLRVGYEFIIPAYVVDLTTGRIDAVPRGTYKDRRLTYNFFEWISNGNLKYKESVSWPTEEYYVEEDDLEWLVEYNPTARTVVSRELEEIE